METIKVKAGEDFPDLSGIPKADDTWNAHITKLSDLGHIHVAGCVTPKINFMKCDLVVFIGPNTTRDDIIQDWDAIKVIRNNLAAYQGSLPKIELPYRQTAFKLHNEFKLSYGDIARLLNFEILVLIYLGLGKIKEEGVLNTEQYYDDFERLLFSFGISDYDINAFKLKAIGDLKKGIVSWNPLSDPIGTDMVREAIRSFSKFVKSNNKILDRRFTRSLRLLESGEAQSDITEIVLKAYPSDKRKIQRYLHRWMNLSVKMIRDRVLHMKEYYLKPATMDDLDRFFP